MAEPRDIIVVKASGAEEPFSEEKLRKSLRGAGARGDVLEEVVSHIQGELRNGMLSSQIYRHAFEVLRRHHPPVAIRYSLRKAVMELGPSGFPFERFLAEIFKVQGFRVQVGGILPGVCVEHEVDVLAAKDDTHIFIEAKYHNQLGIKTDLKVALSVQARFEDIKRAHELRAKRERRLPRVHEGWLVTNTKLTSQAIKYSKCTGITVIGWNYPARGNLQDMILEAGVHPLTCLSSLSPTHKRILLGRGVVLCKSIVNDPDILREIGIRSAAQERVIAEIKEILRN